ncbi:MAG: 30S ribosome-binding factor RbfA [Chloroflexota bacterium]|nr:30S ribosome-binding factor RbfA [Chloroflexota bacterium]MDE2894940.1 30S ribosome-binding factor RbfA [Chloroflexota bacterium]
MARRTRPFAATRDAGAVDRMNRVNDLLRDTIAEVVSRELKDPRLELALLSVTEVRASRDLRNATVFISAMSAPDATPEEQARAGQAAIDALTHAAPFVHRTIRRRLRMKRVPWPAFELDSRIAGSAAIQERINALSESRPSP